MAIALAEQPENDMPRTALTLLAASALLTATPARADGHDAFLPPPLPWHGASESLVAGADDPRQTPAEATGLEDTPDYATTLAWLQKLVAAAPELEMLTIGHSHEGRPLVMVVASAARSFDPASAQADPRPWLLVQAGIHAGEIDGKDAGLMLLRDLTVSGRHSGLLQAANLLFIPVLNPDGHERRSPYNRPNQRGPRSMGWRSNARNQNLNRDFTKLDTPEVRAVLAVIEAWQPDLYMDLHVTDGADYQYDITFGGNGRAAWSPAIAAWIESVYRPGVGARLTGAGHVPGTLVFSANDRDMQDGFLTWSGSARYSNGYGDARHLPSVLVENHSLKPFRQRVLGTYVLLAASLELLGREGASLEAATTTDRARRPQRLPLSFTRSPPDPAERREFLGVRSEHYTGTVSGGTVVRWTGEPDTRVLQEVFVDTPLASAERPAAYLLPAAWSQVAETLALHGIRMQRLETAAALEVERYRLPGAALAQGEANPYEGRMRIHPGPLVPVRETVEFPAGSWRIPTDQPLGDLAMLLLEPASPDSFLQWGEFAEILNRTEYVEAYFMEPLAQRMLADDPALREAFEAALAADPQLAASPALRLDWFYQRSPWRDANWRVYPVARLVGASG